MELYLVSLLDPIMVIPALLIGFLTSGRLRMVLGALLVVGYPWLGLSLGIGPQTPGALVSRVAAAATAVLTGVWLATVRAKRKRSKQP